LPPPVDHEFLGGQAGGVGGVVEEGGVVDQLAPAVHRLHIDFDHAGVGGDAQHFQARIARRLVALDHHRHFQFRASGLDRRGQL
jgi:hypothetical protein